MAWSGLVVPGHPNAESKSLIIMGDKVSFTLNDFSVTTSSKRYNVSNDCPCRVPMLHTHAAYSAVSVHRKPPIDASCLNVQADN
jgi:hypothetical protein